MSNQPPLHWLMLLAQAVEASSCAEVARSLGVSRSTVSLCLTGKYPGGTTRMEQRVLTVLGGHTCPQTGQKVSTSHCQSRRAEAMPTANPYVLQQWRECATCKHFTN
ncbi:MAG: hypothetical protein RRY29_11410 [Desulfovibrionaceae bacterium]